jgi:hypothetical protein
MTPADVKKRVVENALTYLEKGLAEVNSEINFSLLHFYGGVELVVKACLLHEDWRLVVSEPGDADWNSFCEGRPRTVGLEVAAKRLAILKSKPINPEALGAFARLRTHRNQLTHFFHPSLNTEHEKLRVKRELFLAWYYLHRLLQDTSWTGVFAASAQRIAEINVKLQALEPYLQAIFDDQVKGNPNAVSFRDCPVCHFKALNPQTGQAYLDSQCIVCGFVEIGAVASCVGIWCGALSGISRVPDQAARSMI